MFFSSKKADLIQHCKSSWGKLKTSKNNFDLIEYYFRKNQSNDCLQSISDRTINDIDFYSLFAFVDRTYSKIGQQYLLSAMLTFNKSPNFLAQEKLISFFNSTIDKRIETQCILSKHNEINDSFISGLFLQDFISPPKHLLLFKLLSMTSLVCLVGTFLMPKLLLLLIVLGITNLILHYMNKSNIILYSDSIPRLSVLCDSVKNLLSLKLPVGDNETVISSLRSIEKLKKQMSIFSVESKQNADIGSGLMYQLVEYVKILFLLEPIIVFGVLKKLKSKQNDIRVLFEFFGTIDSTMSIASMRAGLETFCIPQLSKDNKGLAFSNLYHPLIPDCVTNSISVSHKSVLLTGSNMSGKTTFIRSIAINTLCAQTLNTCFATEFLLCPTRISSAIRISDDLLSGKSYYFEEVLAINEMIHESRLGSKTLFLLDEIFKGTNTIERIAAGKAVLSYICQQGNIVFVSTHDIELTALLNDTYDLYHFTETVENGEVHFDYMLKRGALKTRNAIRILEINNYPKEVIDEAKQISEKILQLKL